MDDPSAKACMVANTAGIDDHGFNAGTWKGIQDAIALLNIEGKYLESESQTDYATHIDTLISESCDLIITVSFLMGDATAQAASDHPAQKFSIVDVAYDPIHPNILSQVSRERRGRLSGRLCGCPA